MHWFHFGNGAVHNNVDDESTSYKQLCTLSVLLCFSEATYIYDVAERPYSKWNEDSQFSGQSWVRLSIFSQWSIIQPIIQYVGLRVFSLPTPLVMIERIYMYIYIYILGLIIIIKSEVWTITHCLGLGHETMVCAVCLSIFLFSLFCKCVYMQATTLSQTLQLSPHLIKLGSFIHRGSSDFVEVNNLIIDRNFISNVASKFFLRVWELDLYCDVPYMQRLSDDSVKNQLMITLDSYLLPAQFKL